MEKTFGKLVMKAWSPKMPGMIKFYIIRPIDHAEKKSVENQKLFWSGTSMFLYLAQHFRPKIANTWELSKVIDGANQLDSRSLGLKLEPKGSKKVPWDIAHFRYDYAWDPVTTRFLSSFRLYVMHIPIYWWSKAQRSMTPSGSDAKWVELSESVKAVMFMVKLL